MFEARIATGRGGPVRWLAALAAGGCLALCAAPATLDDEAVFRVEEDWELVLNQPGAELESPQFHTVMSPSAGLQSTYFQATFNYRDAETYAPGGMQVQAVRGSDVSAIKEVGSAPLSTTAETVTWTQQIRLKDGTLRFLIKNGQSSSWGSFGGASMLLNTTSTLPNLNGYTTSTSVGNSLITYGSNRVNTLSITRVRYYGSDGSLLHTDESPKLVYVLQGP